MRKLYKNCLYIKGRMLPYSYRYIWHLSTYDMSCLPIEESISQVHRNSHEHEYLLSISPTPILLSVSYYRITTCTTYRTQGRDSERFFPPNLPNFQRGGVRAKKKLSSGFSCFFPQNMRNLTFPIFFLLKNFTNRERTTPKLDTIFQFLKKKLSENSGKLVLFSSSSPSGIGC